MSRFCGVVSFDIVGEFLFPTPGITKEIMSQGPQVLDMECREPDDLSMAPEGPSFL
jgi:hypothetical protein